MKKLAIILISIFTVTTVTLCGCSGMQENGKLDDKAKNIENVQIQEDDSNENKPETPEKPEFPDKDKRDGKLPHPHPHRPHLHPGEKLPRPIPIKP